LQKNNHLEEEEEEEQSSTFGRCPVFGLIRMSAILFSISVGIPENVSLV